MNIPRAIPSVGPCFGFSVCLAFSGLGLQVMNGGSFATDFDDGRVPSGSQVFGDTVVEESGGVATAVA